MSSETKYCELKPDDRLEYQIYLVSLSEAAEVSSSGSADHKGDLFEVGGYSVALCVQHMCGLVGAPEIWKKKTSMHSWDKSSYYRIKYGTKIMCPTPRAFHYISTTQLNFENRRGS